MRVNVKLQGMDKVNEAMQRVQSCITALDDAVRDVYKAANEVGAEIAQPPDETDSRA